MNKTGIDKVAVLDFQILWNDIPVKVRKDIEKLWSDYEYGNDVFYSKFDKYTEEDYPHLAKYVKSLNIEGEILLHYWW